MQFMQKSAYCRRSSFAGNRGLTKTLFVTVPGNAVSCCDRKLIVRAMKLIIFLLTAGFLVGSARGLSQEVSLSAKNVSLETVFTVIKQQTGYVTFSNKKLLNNSKPVSLNVRNMPLAEFLTLALKNEPLQFMIANNTIVLSRKEPVTTTGATPELPAPFTLTGVVHDAKGVPLANINVVAKGSNNGAVTDDSGRFSILVNTGDVLYITGIGFERREIKVTGARNISIVLQYRMVVMDTAAIVFNTGYQKLDKERAAGAFAKPDMKIFMARSGTMDVVSRLEGLVPGLTVMAGPYNTRSPVGFGVAGNQKAVIRGTSTISLSADPLFVVNGVAVTDMSMFNPDDIQDITVLKDASAAAIWGPRAANGVITITTRSGNRDKRLTFNYRSFFNYLGKPDFDYNPVLSTPQFISVAKETFAPDIYSWSSLSDGFIAPHDRILYDASRGLISSAQAAASLDSLSAINNIQQVRDIWSRDAFQTNHVLSVSGGSNIYNFYGSLSYTGTQSDQPGATNNAYRINLNQELTPNNRIRIGLTTALSYARTSSKNIPSIQNTFLPYQLFKDQNGNSINMPYVNGFSDSLRASYEARGRISLNYNPIAEINYARNSGKNLAVNVTTNAEIKLWKGISFIGTYGYYLAPSEANSYMDNQAYSQRRVLLGYTVAPTPSSTPVYYLPTTGGTFQQQNTNQRAWTVRNQLVYNWNAKENRHLLNLQLGQEANEQFASSRSATSFGYDERLQTYAILDFLTLSKGISGAVIPGGSFMGQPFYSTEALNRFTSYFALANYTFAGKYVLNASWRVDHSSLIGKDKSSQDRPIWSIGGKWLLSDEKFVKMPSWVDLVAIRATYGLAGNSPYKAGSSSYDILRPLSAFQSGQSTLAGASLTIGIPANKRLSWEQTQTTNLGLDFSVLHGRINGSFNFYSKNTTGLLGSISVNPITPMGDITGNIGKLVNKGVELSLQTVNLRTRDFSWSTSFIFSYNKNKLLDYNNYSTSAVGRLYTTYEVNFPVNTLFAYKYAGLDNLGDPRIMLADKTITKVKSIAKVNDVLYMGTTVPPFNGGFSNVFTYKKFGLSVNMIYNLGHVMRRDVNTFYTGRLAATPGFYSGNIAPSFLNRWKQAGDETHTDIPSYVADMNVSDSRRDVTYYSLADINVVSASYVKIRDITLTYNLAPALLRVLKIPAMSFNAQVTNFMVWRANHDGIDPEYGIPINGTRLIPPYKHSISLGVNVTF